MTRNRIILTAAFVVMLLGSTTAAHAQSCCIPRLGDDGHAARLVDAIQGATVLLIVVPYSLVGIFAVWFKRRWYTPPGTAEDESSRWSPRRSEQQVSGSPR